jgi:hypothetical protein
MLGYSRPIIGRTFAHTRQCTVRTQVEDVQRMIVIDCNTITADLWWLDVSDLHRLVAARTFNRSVENNGLASECLVIIDRCRRHFSHLTET